MAPGSAKELSGIIECDATAIKVVARDHVLEWAPRADS